jgi:hypothetical protein
MSKLFDQALSAFNSGNVIGSDLLVEPERLGGDIVLSLAKVGDKYIVSVSDDLDASEGSVRNMLPEILTDLYQLKAEEDAQRAQIESERITADELSALIDVAYHSNAG